MEAAAKPVTKRYTTLAPPQLHSRKVGWIQQTIICFFLSLKQSSATRRKKKKQTSASSKTQRTHRSPKIILHCTVLWSRITNQISENQTWSQYLLRFLPSPLIAQLIQVLADDYPPRGNPRWSILLSTISISQELQQHFDLAFRIHIVILRKWLLCCAVLCDLIM